MSDIASWPAVKLCALGAGLLFVMCFGLGAYILVKRGKRRSMTHQELKERILNDDITDMPTFSVAGPGVGVKVEANFNIKTLREEAARGNWGIFWCVPLALFCGFSSAQLFAVALALDAKAPIMAWITGVLLVPICLLCLFMPFAALYTKIDAEVEDPDAELPDWLKKRG